MRWGSRDVFDLGLSSSMKIVAVDTRYAVRVFRCPDYLKMLPRAEIPSSVGHLVPR